MIKFNVYKIDCKFTTYLIKTSFIFTPIFLKIVYNGKNPDR